MFRVVTPLDAHQLSARDEPIINTYNSLWLWLRQEDLVRFLLASGTAGERLGRHFVAGVAQDIERDFKDAQVSLRFDAKLFIVTDVTGVSEIYGLSTSSTKVRMSKGPFRLHDATV